ncbi:MAG: hypothetical protein ACODAJ_00545 [Planctomycetota bacterium]
MGGVGQTRRSACGRATLGSIFSSLLTRHASRITLGLALLLLACQGLVAGRESFQPGKDGWLTLFDGSEKGRWEAGKDADWKFKGGVLLGTKGQVANYWYWTDFELVATLRGTGALRCRISDIIMAEQPGYWLDLADGTLRRDGPRGKVVATGSGEPADGWREVRLVASEGVFTVAFDGKQVARGKDEAYPRMGKLAFVATGEPLALRLLRIRPLGREQHLNVPSPDKACFVCHDNFRTEKLSLQHRAPDGKSKADEKDDYLKPADQRPRRNGCAGCHGPSLAHRMDEDNVTAPDLMYTRGEVEPACLRCHVPHPRMPIRADKQPGPLPPKPVCTDCHGRHRARD